MSRIATASVAVIAAAAAVGLAACSSSGDAGTASPPPSTSASARPAPATTATTTRTATTSVTAGGGDASSATSSATPGGRCAESQLRANVSNNPIGGLARHVVLLTFRNISTTSCTLTGWPGAAIVDEAGHQVEQAKRVQGGPVGGTVERPTTLTVRPGQQAKAYLEGSSTRERGTAQAGCDAAKFPRILVTPPNTRTPVPFTIGWPQCTSFAIHPVRID